MIKKIMQFVALFLAALTVSVHARPTISRTEVRSYARQKGAEALAEAEGQLS